MKISVFGLGYIGLPTATMFAVHGAQVVGIDVKKDAVDTINQGHIHIVEPGLEEVVKRVIDSGQLKASLVPEQSDAFLIAVPTPFLDNHEANEPCHNRIDGRLLNLLLSFWPLPLSDLLFARFRQENRGR